MNHKWPLVELKEEFAKVNTTLILLTQEIIPLIDSVNGDYVLDKKKEKQHIINIRKILNIEYLNDE